MYSALVGFVEPGESIEDCVHREVREEVGVEVDALRYVASQSWPFPHSLMIAYTAEYVAGEVRPCDDEIADARWFARSEERRVGKECRSRWVAEHYNKN